MAGVGLDGREGSGVGSLDCDAGGQQACGDELRYPVREGGRKMKEER